MCDFSLSGDGRVFAVTVSSILMFDGSSFVPFRGAAADFWDAKPITADEAISITSGVMPE